MSLLALHGIGHAFFGKMLQSSGLAASGSGQSTAAFVDRAAPRRIKR